VSSSLTLLRTLGPELASVDDATANTMLGLAAQRLDACVWGELYQQGCVYLALHLLTLRARNAAAAAGSAGSGPIVRAKAGDIEVGYGAALGVLARDAVYSTTPHGIEFLALARSVGGVGAFVAGV
jgi:hypothetical protein